MITVTVECVQGIMMYGQYELTGNSYRLRRWMLSTPDTTNPNRRHVSPEWHRIHGNQRRDIGVLKLCPDQGWLDNQTTLEECEIY